MNSKKLTKAEYIITDNYSGAELTVRLEIDYEQKSFKVKSIRKDNHFTFDTPQTDPARVISIGNAIRNAAEFAKIEMDANEIKKRVNDSYEEELIKSFIGWYTDYKKHELESKKNDYPVCVVSYNKLSAYKLALKHGISNPNDKSKCVLACSPSDILSYCFSNVITEDAIRNRELGYPKYLLELVKAAWEAVPIT